MSGARSRQVSVALHGVFLVGVAAVSLAWIGVAKSAELSGIWLPVQPEVLIRELNGQAPPLTVQARSEQQRFASASKEQKSALDPVARCIPPGVPRIFSINQPFLIMQRPYLVMMLFQVQRVVRQIYLRDAYPATLGPSYMGNSTAHWDGEVLVVETRDFKAGGYLDDSGTPFSSQLQLTERLQRSGVRLEDVVTISDPANYSRSWQARFEFRKAPAGTVIEEDVCADRVRLQGEVSGL